jgi:UDP-3-O-[3-hydroxymyristoyl] glucosamine N-acyltransferase
MEFSAGMIAGMLGGTVEGSAEASVRDVSKIEEGRPGTLSFLANPLYTEHIYSTGATIVIVAKDFHPERALPTGLTLVRVDDPRLAFSKLLEMYADVTRPKAGVHPTAFVSPTATIHPTAFIGPMAVIGEGVAVGEKSEIHAQVCLGNGAQVGHHTIVYQHVVIADRCSIGNHCMLQPGVVIGSDGFGFAPNSENQFQKVVHVGNVIVEDYVEIGANTTIDRATLGSTRICKGVKLDNLIQIAHNVEIGENTVMAAMCGVAGSTKIGKNCMIGGQVGIVGHLVIADEVKIAAQSGIGHSILEKGAIVQGSPAMPIRDFKKAYVHFRNLHSIVEQLDQVTHQQHNPGEE